MPGFTTTVSSGTFADKPMSSTLDSDECIVRQLTSKWQKKLPVNKCCGNMTNDDEKEMFLKIFRNMIPRSDQEGGRRAEHIIVVRDLDQRRGTSMLSSGETASKRNCVIDENTTKKKRTAP